MLTKLFVCSVVMVLPGVDCARPPPQGIFDGKILHNPTNDYVFKKIFSNEDVLLPFINSILHRNNENVFTKVQILNNILTADIDDIREVQVDILCATNSGVEVIIEIQMKTENFFLKRALYYVSRKYSNQLKVKNRQLRSKSTLEDTTTSSITKPVPLVGTTEKSGLTENDRIYKLLKPVYLIAICDFTMFPDEDDYISTHLILNNKTHQNNMNDFSFTYIELGKLRKKLRKNEEFTESSFKTDAEILIYFLLFEFNYEKYVTALKVMESSNEVLKNAITIANSVTWSEKELRLFEQIENLEFRRENEIITGIEKGRTEGKQEGKQEAKKECAINLLLNKKFNLDIKTISESTGLTESEVMALKSELQ